MDTQDNTPQAQTPPVAPYRLAYSLGLLAQQVSEAITDFRPDPHVIAIVALITGAVFAMHGSADVGRDFAIGGFSLVSGAYLQNKKETK